MPHAPKEPSSQDPDTHAEPLAQADPRPSSAPDRQARLAAAYAACTLSLGSSLSFFVTGVAPLPVLLYFPLARRFGFHSQLGELSMDYYGRSLLSLLVGAASALVVYLLCSGPSGKTSPPSPDEDDGSSRHQRPGPRDALPLLVAYAVTASVLAAGLFAYQLGSRVPTPEPLPTAAQSPRI